MRRARGLKTLVHDAVDRTVDLVELGHETTASGVMWALSQAGPLAEPARQVNTLRRWITGAVLGTIKGVNHAVQQVTDAGLDALPDAGGEEELMALRSDLVGSAAWLLDASVGAANGVVGDHLARQANGLDLGMRLRSLDRWIALDGRGVPADASARIVLLVHGLATTEWSWCMGAERLLGDPAANFGTMLQADLGYTPVYARYNTGRHISENGRALSERLDALIAAWPVPVEELLLVGHSMGGLVLRSALQVGHTEGRSWVERVRRVVTLGSPLQGAPLEKFGNIAASILSAVPHPGTLIPAQIINGRSAGIKDLRHGFIHDEEWMDADPDAWSGERRLDATLPPDLSWCFISGTLAESPGHPLSHVLGDLLVRVESASGPVDAPAVSTIHHVGGLHHTALQVHPAVYALVRGFAASERQD